MVKQVNYIEIISGIIGGGTLATVFQTWRERNKDKSDEVFKILDTYKEMITDLRNVENQCKTLLDSHAVKISELQETISELHAKIILMESASNDLPFPMWLKDIDGRMLYLNAEYEIAFLKPNGKTAKDYIGHYDYDVWDKDVADLFRKNDKMLLTLKNNSSWVVEPIMIGGIDATSQWKILKYIRFVGKTPIGIGGIAIPINV